MIFTDDGAAQAGNLGGPAGSWLIGKDFSWALYGGSWGNPVNTLVASETGSQITGDNIYWGELTAGGSTVDIPGTVASSTVYLELFVWEGDTYSTFGEALAAGDYAGDSGVFANPSGGGTNPPYSLIGMPDIFLSPPVPEPGTMVLLAAGGALALLGRRNRG